MPLKRSNNHGNDVPVSRRVSVEELIFKCSSGCASWLLRFYTHPRQLLLVSAEAITGIETVLVKMSANKAR